MIPPTLDYPPARQPLSGAAAAPQAPPLPPLGDGEVHVWRAALDLPEPRTQALAATLASDERARAGRFRAPRDRDRFVAARGLLRSILACYCETEPGRLRFRYGPYGKPAIDAERGTGVYFNLSHAGGMVLYAVARRDLGVDLERVRALPMDERVAGRWFSPEEFAALCALAPDGRREAFARCWTRREAWAKARGEGLPAFHRELDASIVERVPLAVGSTEEIAPRGARWCLRELAPGPGYVAAVAVEDRGARLTFADWPSSEPRAQR
ncbi:MAG TPA: 4'-phosphopantetheinyl transferase superfamily protein [bacterium]|nr:4'-phosphopantetheinyl transferase superfamily protein [bacterium]